MTKKSQRHPSRQKRSQESCIWGLINVFDFRHIRSTRRLLADRRQESKQAIRAALSGTQKVLSERSEKCENVVDVDKSGLSFADGAVKASVKELMAVEMSNEQGSDNHSNGSGIVSDQIGSKNENQMKKNQKTRNKKCVRSKGMDVSRLDATECLPENFDQAPEQKSSEKPDLEAAIEDLTRISQINTDGLENGFHCNLDALSGQNVKFVEEKLVSELKQFIEERLKSRKHFTEMGSVFFSQEFRDALLKLNINAELFFKLLEDQNSVVVKHIQNLEDGQVNKNQNLSSLPASNLSEEKPVNSKSNELCGRKLRSFVRRRSSLESSPLGQDKDCLPPNTIVLLKPGSAVVQNPGTDVRMGSLSSQSNYMDNEVRNDRNGSQFSFAEIKRKIWHAMRRERQDVVPILESTPKHQNKKNRGKISSGENFGWSSPNRNHFYTERFAIALPAFRKGEPVAKSKDKGSSAVDESSLYPRLGGSNIYIEAKRHLSDILKNGDEHPEPKSGQLPKSLGGILSHPEYIGTPSSAPRKYGDDIFISAKMRLSPCGIVENDRSEILPENLNNNLSPVKQILESLPSNSSENSIDEIQSININSSFQLNGYLQCSLEDQCFSKDAIAPEAEISSSAVPETLETTFEGEEKIIDMSSESSRNSYSADPWEGDSREVDNEESVSQLMKESSPSELFGEQILLSPLVSPSLSPVIREVDDSDYAVDKVDRPSPVSILEPLFTDDDISPSSIVSHPVEKDIQPQHIHFEEQSYAMESVTCTGISPEGEESAFEYVEAVLFGSGLNWDEFLSRWLSSYEILDSSLFDEVELFSSRPRHDQKLLFDCSNDALRELCVIYFGWFNVKTNIQRVPKGMDLIHEIWKRVEERRSRYPQQLPPDQLIKLDTERSGKWIKFQSYMELIVFELEEAIVIELVEDFVLSTIDGLHVSRLQCFSSNTN